MLLYIINQLLIQCVLRKALLQLDGCTQVFLDLCNLKQTSFVFS